MTPLVSDELLLTITAALVAALLGVRYAMRFGVPVILFFIIAGMLAGSEGIGGIEFENYELAQAVGTLALVIIMFDGGFHTDRKLFRLGLWPGITLATLGTFGTAVLVAGFAVWFLGFTWIQGLLLGSIVSSTDAAAVFATLRKQNLALKKRVQSVLEIESGSNDPPAVYLTLATTALLLTGEPLGGGLLFGFLGQMAGGLAMGYIGGRGSGWLLRRVRFDIPTLYPVLSLLLALLGFAFTNWIGASGFLAVYVCGIVLGNERIPFRSLNSRFHDGMSWLMQMLMFFTLGLLVFPSRLMAVALPALAVAFFLTLIARPLLVTLLLAGSGLAAKERLLVAWAGLRGAVPIILAIYPLMKGVENSHTIFNIIFFVVIVSVLAQGATIGRLARGFGLHLPSQVPPPLEMELGSWDVYDGEVLLFRIDEGSPLDGQLLRDLPLPAEALAMLIVRGSELVPPRGSTALAPGDYVYLFVKAKDRAAVERIFGPAP